MLSPVFILPTPSGVPVNMRSPCFNGTSTAISHSNSCGVQIMSAQEPDCLNSPFTFNLSQEVASGFEDGVMIYKNGQLIRKVAAFSDPTDNTE